MGVTGFCSRLRPAAHSLPSDTSHLRSRREKCSTSYIAAARSRTSPLGHNWQRANLQKASATATSTREFGKSVVDFYELLGVDDDATVEEIKSSYRYLAKQCHPDYLGNEGHDMCVLLNEAYEVLSDWGRRKRYNAHLQQQLEDARDDYTGKPLSKWLVGHPLGKAEDMSETRAVFVDECSCIGCKMCVWCASATYRIEPEHGRSRVFAQWCDTEDRIQASIESCPVSCIHWVTKEELPALEYVMQRRMERTNVGVMMAGQGKAMGDPWSAAARFLQDRKAKLEKQQKDSRYTPAQEEARRKAAEGVTATVGHGWWGGFSRAFEDALGNVMAGGHSARSRSNDNGNGHISSEEVGKRRRKPRIPLKSGEAHALVHQPREDRY